MNTSPRIDRSVRVNASPRIDGAPVAIVPVLDGAKWIDACVGALMQEPSVRVLLVDDGSGDDSVAVATRLADTSGGRVRVLALGRNHGFAAAVSRGVEACLAWNDAPSLLLLVNQDCIVRPGFLGPLREALRDPRVAVAGARLYEADGVTLQHAGARIHANGLTSHVGRGVRDESFAREAADFDYVCGALMALRAETWTRLGGLDERYFPAYFEEADFCARARAKGMRVVYVPDSEAVHGEASCSSPDVFLARYHRSRLRFVVRRLWPEAGLLRWLRAEAAWLRNLRGASQWKPVLRAYLRVPALLVERLFDGMRGRAAASGAAAEALR